MPIGLPRSIGILTVAFLFNYISITGQRSDQLLKAAGTPVNPKVSIAWNRYYDSQALAELCRKIAKAYPHLVRLKSIGKSHQGSDIWCLTITDSKEGNPRNKPGMYIQGNIHGNEIQGGEVALYIAWYLTESFGDTKYIRDLLRDKVFYIVPTINPDSRDDFIHKANTADTPRGYVETFKNTFKDLDGDGNITQMRIKNPNGIWKMDPQDPRRMVRLKDADIKTVNGVQIAKDPAPGNYEVMIEGSIKRPGATPANDAARWKEDYDPNRDWGLDLEFHDKTAGTSPRLPFRFPETRAVRDFFLKHPNISAAQSFHNSGGELGPAIATSKMASKKDFEEDIKLYDHLGKHGEELLPGYHYVREAFTWKEAEPDREIDWIYGERGAYSFLNELMPSDFYYGNNPYEFDTDLLMSDGWVPWHVVTDPILGKVEVGGFKKTFRRLTPGFLLESDAHRNMAFSLYLASQTPKLEIKNLTVRNIDNGLQEITALVSNTALFPTHSNPDIVRKITRPDYVMLATVGRVVSIKQLETGKGEAKQNTGYGQDKNQRRFEINNIPGKSNITIRWTVEGKGKHTVTVDSVKGGIASASATAH